MTRLLVLLALLLVALTTVAVPAAEAKRSVPAGWLGAGVDGPIDGLDPSTTGEWQRMAAAGVESVRIGIFWAGAQPTPDTLDLRRYDELISQAARVGLRVVPVVQQTPGWAAHDANQIASPPAAGRGTRAYAAFLTTLVRRYGPNGTLWRERPDLRRVPVRAWQIWNEPNLPAYWALKKTWPAGYVRLLRAADRALDRADPGSTTVMAGLVNDSPRALRRVYRAGGRGAFDAVAIHPFTKRPRDVLRLVELTRETMRAAGDPRVPIWVTELTWPTPGREIRSSFAIETTEAGQAARLTQAITDLARARRRLGVARVFWYTWLSREPAGSVYVFDYSGLRRLRPAGIVAVPAFAAFVRIARRLEGCTKKPGDATRCR